jgi:hypothetical protein
MPNRYNEYIELIKDLVEALSIIFSIIIVLVKPYLAMMGGVLAFWLWYQRHHKRRVSGLLTMLLIAFILTNITTPILIDRVGEDLTPVILFLIGVGNYKLIDMFLDNLDKIVEYFLKRFVK